MHVELGEGEVDAVRGEFVVEFLVVVVEYVPVAAGAGPCAHLEVNRRGSHLGHEYFRGIVGLGYQRLDAGLAAALPVVDGFLGFAVAVKNPVEERAVRPGVGGLVGIDVGEIFLVGVGCTGAGVVAHYFDAVVGGRGALFDTRVGGEHREDGLAGGVDTVAV